jgi:glycosyltransferase involved in cell wall biosynthesis
VYEDELAAKAAAGDPDATRLLRGPTRRLLAAQERLVLERAAVVLANGGHAASRVRHVFPHVADRVLAVTCPIDTERFRPAPRPGAAAPYLLFTARINDPRKHAAMLFPVLARARAVHPTLRLVLAGDDPAPSLRRAAADAGVAAAVDFVGHRPLADLVALYQSATLFVLPSLQEGLGISLLEALACGLPAVSTRCGGPEHVLVEGQTGRLVANGDAEAFAAAVLDLLADPPRLATLRDRCARYARETFSRERIDLLLLDAFRSVYPAYFPSRTPGFSPTQ